jgi:SAM-dependent methyltransferase
VNEERSPSGAPPRQLSPEHIDQEIARLLAPGLEVNAWRPDFEALRQRRLWDERYHRRRLRILTREWRGLTRAPILDVGAGRGGLAVALEREGYRVFTADLRHNACRITRLRGQRYGLEMAAVRARGETLPFRSGVFGAVICRDMLEHCELPGQVLGEIWRVLRRGGSCFLTVINRWSWVDPHYHLAGIAFLPSSLAERYIQWRGRSKPAARDRQRLSEMHYYRYHEFVRQARSFGFVVRDLGVEQLARYRHDGAANYLRWLRTRLLRPLSLHANLFELLLCKPPGRRRGTR